ncbi:MAG: NADPH dehydrogenase NamA [Flavobacteriaceae bacterium]|jgi:2,4-dienoyl-CoA reductase-like NADH-dependent reductase (Old Yellow Enzyme family)|nr:NADPH dehydrogenase NamA [Flavobacteriaceae bacterium]
MSKLFTPLQLESITLKNKVVMSPMCQYSAHDGFANDWHLVHYGSRAVGGVAAIIQEATAVSPQGRISYRDLGIWKDEHIPELNKIVRFIQKQNSLAGIQLAHAGRKASVPIPWNPDEKLEEAYSKWSTVAPSPVPFDKNYQTPKELSVDEIRIIVEDFKEAAERAVKAGYDIIEIHAAHGYLIHQFLSPLSNKRTDEYGGSFQNRIRLLTDITEIIKINLPKHVSLWVRISATDWVDGGWSVEESVELVKILKKLGVEAMDVSSGGLVPDAKIPVKPNYQISFSRQIKNQTGITTGTVGLITDAVQAEEILENNEADFVLIGRELFRNPYFTLEAADILGDNIPYPVQYERAKLR